MKTLLCCLVDFPEDANLTHKSGLTCLVEELKQTGSEVRFSLINSNSDNPFNLLYDSVGIQNVYKLPLVSSGKSVLVESLEKTLSYSDELQKREDIDNVVLIVVSSGKDTVQFEGKSTEGVRYLVEEKFQDGYLILFLGVSVPGSSITCFGDTDECILEAYKNTLNTILTNLDEGNKVNRIREMSSCIFVGEKKSEPENEDGLLLYNRMLLDEIKLDELDYQTELISDEDI